MENLFPSPIASPDLLEIVETSLTREEERIASLIGWSHKFDSLVPLKTLNRLQWFVALVPFLTMLINAPGGVDIFYLIMSYLSAKDFLLICAATDNLLLHFFTPASKVCQRVQEKINEKMLPRFGCKDQENVFNFKVVENFTTGWDLLREFRLFRCPEFNWKIDDSSILSNVYPIYMEFNPHHPIVAIVGHNRKLYILAYGGEERKFRGQILFISPASHLLTTTFRFLSWSPEGEYLLAAVGSLTPHYLQSEVEIILCKKKTF